MAVTGTLYVLVEGDDDERFVCRVAQPIVKEASWAVLCYKYACKKPHKVKGFLQALMSRGQGFFYLSDLDGAPCVTARKQKVSQQLGGTVSEGKLIVVAEEIEAWYLAGVDDEMAKELGLKNRIARTDSITKEDFRSMIPKRRSRIDLMQEILDRYDAGTAVQRNASLAYFLDRCRTVPSATDEA